MWVMVMNKLQLLLDEFCPDGVKYYKFNDICDYYRGITYSKDKEAKNEDLNPWKVLRANNISLETNTLNFNDIKLVKSDVSIKANQFLKAGDILICAGSGSKEHIGKVAYIKENTDYTFGGFMAVIRCKRELNSRFLFHVLTGETFKKYLQVTLNSSTINNLNQNVMAGFCIPVPPIPVQEEIVRILDSFTELTAELTARKKQYEYYRDKLLSFKEKS